MTWHGMAWQARLLLALCDGVPVASGVVTSLERACAGGCCWCVMALDVCLWFVLDSGVWCVVCYALCVVLGWLYLVMAYLVLYCAVLAMEGATLTFGLRLNPLPRPGCRSLGCRLYVWMLHMAVHIVLCICPCRLIRVGYCLLFLDVGYALTCHDLLCLLEC